MTPITENENELTNEIDAADSKGIVRMMRGCDAQVFAGYRSFPGLADEEILAKIEAAASVAAEFIAAHKESAVVLSGAGTSGRLACLVAHSFNSVLRKNGHRPIFHYLIAGGQKALFQSQENAEDNPMQGVDDLRAIEQQGVRGKPIRRLLLVGISCGLSASYVGSQVMYALGQPHYAVILVGCNPAEQARDVPVEGWPFTLRDVLYHMQLAPASASILLNPVVGPEAIMGSTRLKGGTVTKIVLETIFGMACASSLKLPFIGRPFRFAATGVSAGDAGVTGAAVGPPPPMETPREAAVRAIRTFQGVYAASYTNITPLADAVKAGAEALRKGGHIYYAGVATEGFAAMIDASEQVPTFGACLTDVQGFLVGDWRAVIRQQQQLNATGAATPIGASLTTTDGKAAAPTTPVQSVGESARNGATAPVFVPSSGGPVHDNRLAGAATGEPPRPALTSSLPSSTGQGGPPAAAADAQKVEAAGPHAATRHDADKTVPDASVTTSLTPATGGAGGGAGGGVDGSHRMAAALDSAPGYGFREGASGKETLAPSVTGVTPREQEGGGQVAPWGSSTVPANPDYERLLTDILPGTKPADLIVAIDSSRCALALAFTNPDVPDHLPGGPLAAQLHLLRSMGDYKRDRGVGSGRLVVVRLAPSMGQAASPGAQASPAAAGGAGSFGVGYSGAGYLGIGGAGSSGGGGAVLAGWEVGDGDGSHVSADGSSPAAVSSAEWVGDRSKLRERVWYASRRLAKYADVMVEVSLPPEAVLHIVPGCHSFSELAVKYVLNVISTGAHVRVGKVFGSRMVDVRLSNNKLFHRAVSIVAQISGRPLQESREFVLRAIYGEEYVLSAKMASLQDVPISQHVAKASAGSKIVPLALLLSTGKFSHGDAVKALQAATSLRALIKKHTSE